MKISHVFLAAIVVLLHSVDLCAAETDNHGVYYSELKALKKAPETKLLFDEDAHQGLAAIQRDVTTYRNLTWVQRFIRSEFLNCDVVMVLPETMPLLYAYIDGVCKKAGIATPPIFITRQEGFFNAFAEKFLTSTGAIVFGQKLIKDLSDDAIEAVAAHEIGHIKHNHTNKLLKLSVLEWGVWIGLIAVIAKYVPMTKMQDIMVTAADGETVMQRVEVPNFLKMYAVYAMTDCFASLIPSYIVNKRFEKEADQFAYEANGKGQGLIEFFELILKKDQLREEEFAPIYALLQQNKQGLSSCDYYKLAGRYYLARAGQSFINFYKKVYHETFIGAHPSPQARIAAAKEYLATQQA